jgi:long-chain fatty acid transport protein
VHTRITHCLAVAALATAPSLINPGAAGAATGYGVGHESITGAGTAYAGGAAAALDASTIHYNPAGMSLLDHNELQLGTQIIMPTIRFENQGSTIFDGSPLTGTNSGNGGKLAVVPNFYYVRKLDDRISYGIGVTAPWGLVTNYDADWLGRYNEIKTSLRVANVNPSLSYKVTEQLSVGVGFNVQYGIGKLRQAIDFGTVCAGAISPAVCSGGFGLEPQQDDGYGKVVGKDWGFGYNLGILYQPFEDFRVGAHYRSHVKLKFGNGKVHFDVPANARAFLGVAGIPTAFTDTSASFNLTMPEQASISAFYKFDPRWAVMSDLTWTRWSRFDALVITFGEPNTPTNTLQTQWLDVYRFALGSEFYYSDALTLRAGYAYDQSPIRDAFRGPGIPDSNRHVASVGLSYKISDSLTADVSYQHLFFDKGRANRVSATGSFLRGVFDVNVDVIGLGFRWKM